MKRAPISLVKSVDGGAVSKEDIRGAFVTVECGVMQRRSPSAIRHVDIIQNGNQQFEAFHGVSGSSNVHRSLPMLIPSVDVGLVAK